MFNKLVSLLKPIFVLAAMFLLVCFSKTAILSAKQAMTLCYKAIIPSLFPFMILSQMFLSSTDAKTFKIFEIPANNLFGISSVGLSALIPGLICGYPIGARCAGELYGTKRISKSEAEALIGFCNNCGPLFVIGAVGTGILGDKKAAIVLYLIHIFSALVCGVIIKSNSKETFDKSSDFCMPQKISFVNCVANASLDIIKICGFIIIFSIINSILSELLFDMPSFIKCVMSSFLEITNGLATINHLCSSREIMLASMSGALGWSGLSVHMQVKSVIKKYDLSLRKYYFSKILSSVISFLFSYIYFSNFKFNFVIPAIVIVLAVITLKLVIGKIKKRSAKLLF